ncbi:MAG: aspartate aminotransferase family protein [Oligoflexales bacterium]
MKPTDVYPLYPVTLERAEGPFVFDTEGTKYIDFYSGHGVISIGHCHPRFVERLSAQLARMPFYSNITVNPLQLEAAQKLGEMSGYNDYSLFLCSSGTESNEHAFKVAHLHNGRERFIAFSGSFHGRTALAHSLSCTAKIKKPIFSNFDFLPLNDIEVFKKTITDNTCAVIIEGIQGIGGVYEPTREFMQAVRKLCDQNNVVLIIDEIQSGFGRSGDFFAHKTWGVTADIITTAKGMGNGFPVGGVMIHPKFQLGHGALGTTFGGNYLACQATLAVLEVIEREDLMSRAKELGAYLIAELSGIEGVKEVRGRGFMVGIEFDFPIAKMREHLLFEHKIFTGNASSPNCIRLLPPLSIDKEQIDQLIKAIKATLEEL